MLNVFLFLNKHDALYGHHAPTVVAQMLQETFIKTIGARSFSIFFYNTINN